MQSRRGDKPRKFEVVLPPRTGPLRFLDVGCCQLPGIYVVLVGSLGADGIKTSGPVVRRSTSSADCRLGQ